MHYACVVALACAASTSALDTSPCGPSDRPADCNGLVSLYEATGRRLDWTMDGKTSLCSWRGVGCDGDRATSLILSANHLTGTLPTELGSLDAMRKLWLDYNMLSGTVPTALSALSSVEELWLNYNHLSGTVPPELSRLSSVKLLFLYAGRLSGTVPPALSKLNSLTQLALSASNISGTVPRELGQCAALPRTLGAMRLAEHFGACAYPPRDPRTSRLASLTLIDTYQSRLSGTLPTQLGKLASIDTLSFGQSAISGSVPVS